MLIEESAFQPFLTFNNYRSLASALHWCQSDYMFINFFSLIKISAVILTNLFFILALDQLYELSRKVLKDEYLGDHKLLCDMINLLAI